MDACFSAKRYSSSGAKVSDPSLDEMFYMPTPSNIPSSKDYDGECSNFRSGDQRLKAKDGRDVNAVFAAVCVHGFAYRIIGKFNPIPFMC